MDHADPSSVPQRLETVEAELRALRLDFDRLASRLVAFERSGALPPEPSAEPVDEPLRLAGGTWLQHSAVLRRVATISFVLVIALVLRTLTDNGLVETGPGIWIGVGYAALLMVVGWRRLSRDRPGQRVFPICGVVLLAALVLEATTRFEHFGAATANGLMLAALLATAGLGLAYRAPSIVEAGALAAAVTTLALGFPTPLFPFAAALLILTLVVSALVVRLRTVAWSHWLTFATTGFFWLLWTFKIGALLARGEAVPPELWIGWFLPALVATFAAALVIAFVACRTRPSPFWLLLPTVNVAGAMLAAAFVVVPRLGIDRSFGVALLAIAGVHLVLARLLAGGARTGVAAVAGHAIAATVAFVPATWFLTQSAYAVPPLAAAAGYGLLVWSGRLQSAGLRLFAQLVQIGCTVGAIVAGVFAVPPEAPWAAAGVGAVLATFAGMQYLWSRRVPPPPESWYERLPPAIRPGRLDFHIALAATFCCLRVLIHPVLAATVAESENAFAGAQSVLLNVMAIVLLVVAQRRRSGPVLSAAVVVAVLGGLKVFASDLLMLHGLPLVLGVFAFGMTAAIGSVVLGRWQRASLGAA